MRNLTISLPDEVLARLRLLAAERQQSVNRLAGEYLTDLAGVGTGEWAASHRKVLEEIGVRDRKSRWSRDEIYEGRFG